MTKPNITLAAILTSCFAFGGCAAPEVVGSWESDDMLNGKRSELDISDSGTGEATIYFVVTVGDDRYLVKDQFDLDWDEVGDGEFELDMDCSKSDLYEGNCDKENFTMECESKKDGTEMDCTGDETFSNFEWTFERND